VPALGLHHHREPARLDGGRILGLPRRPAFYWPPGHAPEAIEECEFLEISPTDELRSLYEHLAALRGS
jgi:hypothetical protein